MKIEKEIIFAAKIDKVRALLDSYGFKNNQPLNEVGKLLNTPSNGHSSKNISPKKATLIKSIESSDLTSQITTIYDLAECGNRTLLKVTVHGWEKINPETAKTEMPQVALLLERELSRMKKRFESRS